jgi:hypothetical protein
VVEIPPGARAVAGSAFTPAGVLVYDDRPAISMQFHPEFDPAYARALIEARRGSRFTDAQADAAIASLDRRQRPRPGGRLDRSLSRPERLKSRNLDHAPAVAAETRESGIMRTVAIVLAAGSLMAGGALLSSVRAAAPDAAAAASPETLKSAADFASIKDPAARSVALFTEAGKVIQSPRCMNCHPVQRAPTQGDDRHPHNPPMVAGQSGHGPVGMSCASCHGPANFATWGQDIKSIPGDPKWALAPVEMAWQGKSLGAICAQIKDPAATSPLPAASS